MRLFSQEIETWPCSVIGVLVLLKMALLFGVMCRKNGKTIIFFPLPLLSSQLMDARVSGLLNLL